MNSAKEAKEKDSDVRDLWSTQVGFGGQIENYLFDFRSNFFSLVWALSLALVTHYVSPQ